MTGPLYARELYAAARDDLLRRAARVLEADPRFAAAWLYGSFGRGEQDTFSDIDLVIAVYDQNSAELCERDPLVSAGSNPARLALFRKIGDPVNIHENHHNAPQGGSFSAVLYREPAVIVDWTLVPLSSAERIPESRPLFDKVGVPLKAPEPLPSPSTEMRAEKIAERAAFFWMMAAVTAKYIARGNARPVQGLLDQVAHVVEDLERLHEIRGEPISERLYVTQGEQTERLLALCDRVQFLGVPGDARDQVEEILHL
jgi:hypothetical protein